MDTQDTTLTQCDTVIIGHSMAGACLARQLKLAHPEMNIVVIEKKKEFGYWVGESTLESFWSYAATTLELGHYLDTNHLYKHGLRFFYDSENHDLPLSQMSEVGRSWYHATPAYQLDRKKFDTDMVKFNLESGIDVRLGVTVKDFTLDKDQGHTVNTSEGDVKCKWLIDAAGFGTPIARKLDVIELKSDEHPIHSYWARIKGTANLDLLGGKEWRERVNYTTRTLATTHFMYGDYWFWLIPLDGETYSIGLVTKNDKCDIKIKGKEAFLEFLRTHKCMEEFLPQATTEILDYHQMKNLSRRVAEPFSKDRWFLTGMSGAFLDPLLSPGSAYLADSNRMIGEMIAADIKGDEQAYHTMTAFFNRFSNFWLDNFFLHIKGQYHDSYDRQRVYFTSMLMQWFGVILPSSMVKNWGYQPGMTMTDFDAFSMQMNMMTERNVIHKIDELAHQFQDYLKDQNVAYEKNQGQFYDVEIDPEFMNNTRTMGKSLTMESIFFIESKMLEITYQDILARIAEVKSINIDKQCLQEIAMSCVKNEASLTEAISALDNAHLNMTDNSAPIESESYA